ncbi:Hypothetical predicted protein [Cloeon dipterum]|uniref:C3H1-type domain-containing protein n=1 Tax=Cloeon dipterum TaxID=197152 RepID=A0A8S1D4E8_9INSE|nr:Hypothetical predicted protein [Cloeon dipterum]
MGNIYDPKTMSDATSTDSAEEGEIRDSDEEENRRPRNRSKHRRISPPSKNHRSVRTHKIKKPHSSRREQPPRSRKRRSSDDNEYREDIDTQIAKTRRRLQAAEKSTPPPAVSTPPAESASPEIPQEDEIQVLEVPPKTFEVVQIDDEETGMDKSAEVEETEKELTQLRLDALKSSLEAKWGGKKKKRQRKSNPDEPYSPTCPLTPVDDLDSTASPAPSPPSPAVCDPETDEDEEALRLSLLKQIKKSSEDKENETESTNNEVQAPETLANNSDMPKKAVTEQISSHANGRFIISIGPDSSDSESESEKDPNNVAENIDQMLKKIRETAEEKKKKVAPPPKKTAGGRNKKSPAKQVPLNHPLSVLPKSKQAEYLRLKALLKKKEELRQRKLQHATQEKLDKAKAISEMQLPSLNALAQSLPLLTEEERIKQLRALEADQEKFIEKCKEQKERLASLRSDLDKNLSDQQEVQAVASAAGYQRAQLEQEAEMLRRRLAEVEAAAAASSKQHQTYTLKLHQLKSEARMLQKSVSEASLDAARLRAGCSLIREACSQARGDSEVKALEAQLNYLDDLANGPLSYQSPLDHVRNKANGNWDPNQAVCPGFLSGQCRFGINCTLQHPRV